jgi:hypothetical protein
LILLVSLIWLVWFSLVWFGSVRFDSVRLGSIYLVRFGCFGWLVGWLAVFM